MTAVTITEDPMSLQALIAVADGAQIELSDPVRIRIADARAVVDRALAANDAVYGLTTQVGHGKDTRLTEQQLRGAQLFLIRSHAGGLGPPLGVRTVRATLAARLNGIARGGSGASLAAADVLVALLNHGVHPQVPSTGSVGANPSILHPAVAAATGIAGHRQAADHLRELLAGSRLLESVGVRSVQDALSFRVVPQVHGAFRHYLAALEQSVTQELNAASDNPLASVAEQTMISNGNFQPMVLAIAVDALRIAVTHVGQLSERRMAHLWDAFYAQLGHELPGPALGLPLRYPAAAVYAELRHLAAPATLDPPTLDFGVEDHASGAPLSLRLTERALDLLQDLLAIETLLARDVLALTADRAPLGHRTGALLADLDDAAATGAGAAPQDIHREVRNRLARATLE